MTSGGRVGWGLPHLCGAVTQHFETLLIGDRDDGTYTRKTG